MEGINTPGNVGNFVKDSIRQAQSRPRSEHTLLDEVPRPLGLQDDGRQEEARRLAPTRPSSQYELDHLRRHLRIVDDLSTPPRLERPHLKSSTASHHNTHATTGCVAPMAGAEP